MFISFITATAWVHINFQASGYITSHFLFLGYDLPKMFDILAITVPVAVPCWGLIEKIWQIHKKHLFAEVRIRTHCPVFSSTNENPK